jgi:hypothetical protein
MKVDPALADKSLAEVTDKPTPQALEETASYQDRENELKLAAIKENIEAKKKYAHRLFVMLCVWLGLVLIVVLFQGLARVPFFPNSDFDLSEAVLITLITTTTANVAAFFLVVTNHLFPTKQSV